MFDRYLLVCFVVIAIKYCTESTITKHPLKCSSDDFQKGNLAQSRTISRSLAQSHTVSFCFYKPENVRSVDVLISSCSVSSRAPLDLRARAVKAWCRVCSNRGALVSVPLSARQTPAQSALSTVYTAAPAKSRSKTYLL